MEKAKKGTLFHILFHFMKKIAYWKMIPILHKQSQEEEGKKSSLAYQCLPFLCSSSVQFLTSQQ